MYELLEELLHEFSQYSVIVFEIACITVIIVGGIRSAISLFKQDHHQVALKLSQYMDTALLFKLAAEIIRLTYVRTYSELGLVAGIVLLHGAISYIIQWEDKHRAHKRRAHKQEKQEKDKEKAYALSAQGSPEK